MNRERIVFDSITIASPCGVPWKSMRGDDRVRFCGECQLSVYNLSKMTRSEWHEIIENHDQRICVSMLKRADGTIITRDCPVGSQRFHRYLSRIKTIAAAVLAVMTFGTISGGCCMRTQGAVDLTPRAPARQAQGANLEGQASSPKLAPITDGNNDSSSHADLRK